MRVGRYLLGRTIRAVLTLLIMIAITFVLYFAIEKQPPVAFFFPSVGRGTQVTPAQIKTVHHAFYLDANKLGLFVSYVGHLARGDLGTERVIDSKGHVVETPLRPPYQQLRATLSILIGGALLVLLISLPLGGISGARVGSWADRLISFGALVLVCCHPMMLGLILRSAGGSIHWLPTSGYCTFVKHPAEILPTSSLVAPGTHQCGGPTAWATHLILPWLTFALLFLALYTRMIRASVAETIHEDFVRTARAKGASRSRVIARHVLPSASLRVLTMVGMEIGTAIGVCIYIEAAFNIGGLGSFAVQELAGANITLDLPTDLAIVVLITLVVIVGNLVVDLLYVALDPRAGTQHGAERTKSFVGGVF